MLQHMSLSLSTLPTGALQSAGKNLKDERGGGCESPYAHVLLQLS